MAEGVYAVKIVPARNFQTAPRLLDELKFKGEELLAAVDAA